MKKFTCVFLAVVLLGFGGLITYVAAAEDFVKPDSRSSAAASTGEIWTKTFDDLIDYITDLGLIENSKRFKWPDGAATVAYTIDGVTYYWWDVENLDEDSNEYRVYHEVLETGQCDMWGDGMMSSLELNGPFGLEMGMYPGDKGKLIEAFYDFCKEEEPLKSPVWSKSYEDLIAYLVDLGLLEDAKRFPWPEGAATIAYTIEGVNFYWWDVENLEEGTNEYRVYHELTETGQCDMWNNGLVDSMDLNGPFGMSIGGYTGDTAALIEAFYNFGKE